ncbi:MAG: single-stranded-DNA-specific exonuclease RecJ [Ruminococcaceae bacterium]|nr:single-stranded-DNA-specific exonuclease RecJ [Oscillospiraceae bacterium]
MFRKKIKWMCIALKYGVWNVQQPEMNAVNALVGAGYSPLTAMILSARGMTGPTDAEKYLSCSGSLPDPFLIKDMDLAAGRVGLAMTRGEKIAVFGDYDVDGITATCLLTDFLRCNGADCVSYIPGRLEEGYGLNPIAIHQLHSEGVKLIITVDCGITAVEEARLCRELGIDLVITDHHECKDQLPQAVAVVDPHRKDDTYPHQALSGVGVAFKLAAALCGSQEQVLEDYADMVCLGTVADVMPLQGENRVFVSRGLAMLQNTARPGIAALMQECNCEPAGVNAASIGFMLAPRINAAGRMGQIQLAIDLFLTEDPIQAQELAQGLCELNRQRQQVESQIYTEAISMLPEGQIPDAIVLADEGWHQGVVGIVASRIAEEYCCPTFLICLDGDHGKASSRSYGGFNLFTSLKTLSPLLESYGGHELAAGFTINRHRIGDFRREITALAQEFYADAGPRTVLDVDCCIQPELLTIRGIDALAYLEPTGNGCPKPVLMMQNLMVERIHLVGNGRHMRLRLRSGNHTVNAIYFSATPETASIEPGDIVDVAFSPQINEFRGERTPQMNILDIRPSCAAPCSPSTAGYAGLLAGTITAQEAAGLYPERSTLAMVWRYLANAGQTIREDPMCLCRKIVRWSGSPLSLGQMLTCLDIFRDVGLLQIRRMRKFMIIDLTRAGEKADLNTSKTMQTLLRAKES